MVDESFQNARWHGPVSDETIARVESAVGGELPRSWREYIQRERWLEEGWLESGAFLRLHEPMTALRVMEAWGPSTALHPGIFFLGDDGSREMYAVNLDDDDPEVMSVDLVSSGWGDAESLGMSIAQFTASIDDGTFDPLAEVD